MSKSFIMSSATLLQFWFLYQIYYIFFIVKICPGSSNMQENQ